MTKDELRERLRTDWAFYAPQVLKIVGTDGRIIPLDPKPAQQRIWEAIKAQQDAERPVRIIIPKARKEGVSTMAQSLAVQRVTQMPNHRAITIANDGKLAGELLSMAHLMYANLPPDPEWALKPPIANWRRQKEMVFGEPARNLQNMGHSGINSSLIVDTARELEAGRGFTFHTVIGSEVAFWPDTRKKLTSLLNAVPDDPSTLVLLESTSNGHNHWRKLCMDALEGANDFTLVFLPWFEEPQYTKAFLSDEERQEFIESVGSGPWGEQEAWLIAEFGLTPEQLNWRRWAIANQCQGDLRLFQQEFPATLEESFLSSSRVRFPPDHIARARKMVEAGPKAAFGTLHAPSTRTRRLRYGAVEIPENPVWTEQKGPWYVWEPPQPDHSYIVSMDPAGGDQAEPGEAAMHGIQVIDHRTRMQVAEYQSQEDPDIAGDQAYLAALFYNRAWIVVETTGGWGLSIIRRFRRDYGYQFLYMQKRLSAGKDAQEDRLGWDTNRTSKVVLEDTMAEILREGTHGIRSMRLIRELQTYIRDERGRSGASPGARSDLLMAYMIAHTVAQELPLKEHRANGGVVSTTTRAIVNPKAGY